jgi:dihydropyrimidinase
VLWDPAATKTISVKTQFSKGDFNVFEGRSVKGNATHTLSQGKLVWADGDLRAVQGAGRYVKRPPFGPNFQAAAKRSHELTPTAVAR